MSAYFGSGQQIELALKLRNGRAFRFNVGARVSPAPNLISHWSLKTKRPLEIHESYKIDVQTLKVWLDLNKSLLLTPIQTLNFEIETEHHIYSPIGHEASLESGSDGALSDTEFESKLTTNPNFDCSLVRSFHNLKVLELERHWMPGRTYSISMLRSQILKKGVWLCSQDLRIVSIMCKVRRHATCLWQTQYAQDSGQDDSIWAGLAFWVHKSYKCEGFKSVASLLFSWP